MCGEIQDWQEARGVTVRLTTDGTRRNVVLGGVWDDVEEIRLDEIMITGFNGGVSGGCYLQIFQPGMRHGTVNNESNSGLLIPVDVLNPHVVHNRPRVIARGQMVNISQFGIGLFMPNGTPATFTEAMLILTFVMRKSADAIEEVRRLKATVDYLPSKLDVANTFNPYQ